MYNPEFVQEKEVRVILCDFEIQADHTISTRRLYLVFIYKKKKYVILWILLLQSATE